MQSPTSAAGVQHEQTGRRRLPEVPGHQREVDGGAHQHQEERQAQRRSEPPDAGQHPFGGGQAAAGSLVEQEQDREQSDREVVQPEKLRPVLGGVAPHEPGTEGRTVLKSPLPGLPPGRGGTIPGFPARGGKQRWGPPAGGPTVADGL
jgi:hypothetical protein